MEARLVGGVSSCSGRLEVAHGETWARVCDAHFDLRAARVICKQLDCGTVVSISEGAHFGEANRPVKYENHQCAGNETVLFHCPRSSQVDGTCTRKNGVSIVCSENTGFRLVDSSTECSGRVEIQLPGGWTGLCSSYWDLPDANVLCHQLGCGFAVSLLEGGHLEKGNGSGWRGKFHCNGSEPHLWHCPLTVLGTSQCLSESVAGVICSGKGKKNAGFLIPTPNH
uniref:SRCR domain-containing protein n=1 Tax=Sphenodon punctatus TaxID=8508 RepID=A0A8D0HD32_SPHPU